MRVFCCLRIERNLSLFKRRAWTCLYNVGPHIRTVVLGYEVQHYMLQTKWRRIRGRTWLERREYADVFSEEQWGMQNGWTWRYIKWQLRQVCFSHLLRFDYMRLVLRLKKRDHAQSVTQKNTLSFSASLPKKVQYMLRRRYLFTARAIFSKHMSDIHKILYW